MIEDKFIKAKELKIKIAEQKDLYANVLKLLPEGDTVEVKIRGTKFHLPKKLFVAEHKKISNKMKKDIAKLEKEFSDI